MDSPLLHTFRVVCEAGRISVAARMLHLSQPAVSQQMQRLDTREGIHLGAAGGALDILQRCYTGLDTRDDILWFDPQLPDELPSLDFDIRYRDQWITVHIEHSRLVLGALPCAAAPTTVAVGGSFHQLAAGGALDLPLAAAKGTGAG